MRKVVLLIALLCSICIKAQFAGGFDFKEPSGLKDKEIFFWCRQNVIDYYGNPQMIRDVLIRFDGGEWYKLTAEDEWWKYGDYIIISNKYHKFDKKCTVEIWWKGYIQGIWTCDLSNKLTKEELLQYYLNKKRKDGGRIKLPENFWVNIGKRVEKFIRWFPKK